MNTREKARAWLDAQSSWSNSDAHKIITALLAEREALLDATRDSLSGFRYIAETYGGIYGVGATRVIDKCEKAIAMCEESK